jgi:hypothetical protein
MTETIDIHYRRTVGQRQERPGGPPMFKKILIANNGSEGAFKALVEALRLAHSHGSEAHMIYVEENIPWNSQEARDDKKTLDRKFADLVAKAEAEAKHHSVKLTSQMLSGRPAPAIADFLRSHGGFDYSWEDCRPSRRTRPLRCPSGEMNAQSVSLWRLFN